MASNAFTAKLSYDLFLSYNSADRRIVEEVAHKLADAGLKELFLDRWNLLIGTRWRPMLEKALGSSKAVAIFVGPGEMGSWQQREVDIALDLQSKSPNFPVIPVLLPGCEPPLGFLGQLTWVDFRSQTLEVGIAILAKAARGEEPGSDLQRHLDAVLASICPYRGLLHFREEDAPFFFGREAAIDKLASAVERQPFVAVVGASGSGKSSVVRAGLVPRLRSDHHTSWEMVILVPTDQPLKALARALLPLLEPAMGEVDRIADAAKLAEHFRSGTVSLYDIIRRILEKQSGTDRVLIVVDQFEELYTLTSDEEARRRFLDELLAASSRAGSKANITLTLRGDFVGKALAYRPLSDRLQDAQINLGPMNREELECAIRKPAEKIELEFEPGLVRRILNDVGDEPGNLPLLEFVLKELWDERRSRALLNETYDAIGGLQGALASKADELLRGLSSVEQKILQRIFLRIVRPLQSGVDTRRRAAFGELPPEAAELVVKLANARLLVTDQSAGGLEQTVEVAHEALISNWGTLRTWVNEDRQFLMWRERLGALLAEWERAKESHEALLRGPILIEAQRWFGQRSQDLSDQERKFISASRELRERLAREERERQERDLDAARKLAETERKRAETESNARRRQRYFIIALAGVLVALGLIAAIAMRESNSLKEETDQQADLLWRASRSDFAQAQREITAGSYDNAIAYFARALQFRPDNVAAEAELVFLASRGRYRNLIQAFPCSAELAAFSPDGSRILTVSSRTVQIWDTKTGQQLTMLKSSEDGSEINSAQISSDGSRVVTTRFDNPARGTSDVSAFLWDGETGEQLSILTPGGRVSSARFSPDGSQLVTSGDTQCLWDAKTGKQLVFLEHNGLNSVEFGPDGSWIVTTGTDNSARVWNAKTGKQLVLLEHNGVNSAKFSPDGSRIVTTGIDNTARVWDAKTGKQLALLEHNGVNSVEFSPDASRIVTTGADNKARVWDAETGRQLFILEHNGLSPAVFSPDGSQIVIAASDNTARVSDAQTGKQLFILEHNSLNLSPAVFSPDGSRIVTLGGDNSARVWDARAGKPLITLKPNGGVISAAFSPDGRWLLTASEDKIACLWDTSAGEQLTIRSDQGVSSVFSPDGGRILTKISDHAASIWDAKTGDHLATLKGASGALSMKFSADGSRLLSENSDQTLGLWDAKTGQQVAVLRPIADRKSPQFSPDGSRVLARSSDHTVALWDAKTGEQVAVLHHEGGNEFDPQFSPDGTRVLARSSDHTVALWDAKTGEQVAVLHHEGGGNEFDPQFSPDGSRVLTKSSGDTAVLWDAKTGSRLFILEHKDVNLAEFSPNGNCVMTRGIINDQATGYDDATRIWDVKTGEQLGLLIQHDQGGFYPQFSPDGSRVLSLCGSTVILWDSKTGKKLIIVNHDGYLDNLNQECFSPDGNRALIPGSNDAAVLWDANSGKQIAILQHGEAGSPPQFSPDGSRILAAGSGNRAQLWDAKTGEQKAVLQDTPGRLIPQFGLNGRRILTNGPNHTAILWDTKTGEQLFALGDEDMASLAQFSPDGTKLLLSSESSVTFHCFPPLIYNSVRSQIAKESASLAGLALDADGNFVQSDAQQCLRFRAEFQEKHPSQPELLGIYLEWLGEDSLTRTVSPWTKITVPDWVELQLLISGTVSTDLLKLSPTHPLLVFFLQKRDEKPARLNFLRDYGLRELQAPETVKIYGSARVARYAQEAARMLADAEDFTRANRCIERTLQLDPTRAEAIDLQARIRERLGK